MRDVHKWYGSVHAVRGVSFAARRGEVVGLLGPNGAGKSTTIRMITGVFPPTKGTIAVEGHSTVHEPEAARRAIGYLPESAPLYPEMSVEGYLSFRASLFELPSTERRRLIDQAIERVAIGPMRGRRIGTLSKGYRQRVGLASAMLHGPGLLILDEPANGLDPAQIRQMRETIRALAQNACVLLSSHILGEVELTCDRVVIIANGVILADGTPAELRAEHAGGHGRVVVEVARGDAIKAEAELRVIPGVSSARVIGGDADWATLHVDSTDPAGIQASIGQTLVRAGVPCRSLHAETATLEQVFTKLLERSRTEAAA
ncbi:MAG TPA: ABC transporter ATP-binding protein [Phycisphaerales bacterium]